MKQERSRTAFVVSVAIHVVAALLLGRILLGSYDVSRWIGSSTGERPVEERITYTDISARAGPAARTPAPATPGAKPVAPRPIIAPTEIPTGVSTPPAAAVPPPTAAAGGTGAATSADSLGPAANAASVRPRPLPSVLTTLPMPNPRPPKSAAEIARSEIATAIKGREDSLAALPKRRAAGDWTIERGGNKYGIDPQFIHIGPISIPTALLALIPIRAQANPNALDRERRIGSMNADIRMQSADMQNMKDEVKRIRERVERERLARMREKAASGTASTPPPVR